MKLIKFKIVLAAFALIFLTTIQSQSDSEFDGVDTDTSGLVLLSFFDLRERESFIQITNVDPGNNNIHIQIFDVSNNCNENNFFDLYTPNDTHIYNLRDITTNDGSPSGVALPDGAYGIVAVIAGLGPDQRIIGNLRMLDNNGYEYRSNIGNTRPTIPLANLEEFATFNFNTESGVTLSDVFIITNHDSITSSSQEARIDDVLNVWSTLDVDIYDLNENPFSCRNVIASCVNSESVQYETLLEVAAEFTQEGCLGGACAASVADLEYGINDAIPHSKGGELLCPGNNISEGFVRLEKIGNGSSGADAVYTYVGLNNGNGRGSMDMFLNQNREISQGG